MSDPAAAATTPAAATTATTTATGQTWFSAMPPEDIGYLQTKGWDKPEPTAAATEMLKAYREYETFRGIPQDQLLRMPKDTGDTEGWKTLMQKLGAPAKPEDYDFSAVKFDDEGLTTKFQGAFRDTAAKLNMPKSMAEEFAKAVHKTLGEHGESTAAIEAGRLAEDRAKLVENWGPEEGTRFRGNMFVADQAAERLGVTQEQMAALKDGIGGPALAELFRKIGAGMGEDRMVRDPGQGGRDVMTREQAVERRNSLLGTGVPGSGDTAFQERYMNGDVAARNEINALIRLIAGEP